VKATYGKIVRAVWAADGGQRFTRASSDPTIRVHKPSTSGLLAQNSDFWPCEFRRSESSILGRGLERAHPSILRRRLAIFLQLKVVTQPRLLS
jgi:hypothetical protein